MRRKGRQFISATPGKGWRDLFGSKSRRQKGQRMKICKMECLYAEDLGGEFAEQEPELELKTDLIFAKLINSRNNLELLRKIPGKSVLDLSLVYYMYKQGEKGEEEVLITNEMVKQWEIDEESLFQLAMDNSLNLQGAVFQPLRNLIDEMLKDIHMDISLEEDDSGFPMYVLTNENKRNGAVCMLYGGMLSDFAEDLGSDLLVIPSSVHEVILVPAGSGIKREELDHIIQDINRTELFPADVLSDHAYFFSPEIGRLIM